MWRNLPATRRWESPVCVQRFLFVKFSTAALVRRDWIIASQWIWSTIATDAVRFRHWVSITITTLRWLQKIVCHTICLEFSIYWKITHMSLHQTRRNFEFIVEISSMLLAFLLNPLPILLVYIFVSNEHRGWKHMESTFMYNIDDNIEKSFMTNWHSSFVLSTTKNSPYRTLLRALQSSSPCDWERHGEPPASHLACSLRNCAPHDVESTCEAPRWMCHEWVSWSESKNRQESLCVFFLIGLQSEREKSSWTVRRLMCVHHLY